jgi:Alkyl sulfatase dimerisation/Alkyl sulfatase C-terminal/Metallo-beta-lactamase superfamily
VREPWELRIAGKAEKQTRGEGGSGLSTEGARIDVFLAPLDTVGQARAGVLLRGTGIGRLEESLDASPDFQHRPALEGRLQQCRDAWGQPNEAFLGSLATGKTIVPEVSKVGLALADEFLAQSKPLGSGGSREAFSPVTVEKRSHPVGKLLLVQGQVATDTVGRIAVNLEKDNPVVGPEVGHQFLDLVEWKTDEDRLAEKSLGSDVAGEDGRGEPALEDLGAALFQGAGPGRGTKETAQSQGHTLPRRVVWGNDQDDAEPRFVFHPLPGQEEEIGQGSYRGACLLLISQKRTEEGKAKDGRRGRCMEKEFTSRCRAGHGIPPGSASASRYNQDDARAGKVSSGPETNGVCHETDDHLFVWLPGKKVLLCGDNFYRSFPNLYTIRGTRYRKVKNWISSLDHMRDLKPAFLVPGHTRPLSGAEHIQKTLTDYRDAIQYVHDQTLRGLNQGQTADELAASIKLPSHLARSPYLQEYYGKVSWSVRAIWDGHLGWFDGDATHLLPLPPRERARRMADLAGGEEALLKRAEKAASAGDHRWALELTGYVLRLSPEHARARKARAKALAALGEAEQNAPARLYYLTQAREVGEGLTPKLPARAGKEVIHAFSLGALFASLTTRLDPEASKDMDRRVVYHFPDTKEVFTVHVRRGVAEARPRDSVKADLEVSVEANVWKEVVARLRPAREALDGGQIKVRGGRRRLEEFLGLFGIK